MSMEGPFEREREPIFHKGVGLKCCLFICLPTWKTSQHEIDNFAIVV